MKLYILKYPDIAFLIVYIHFEILMYLKNRLPNFYPFAEPSHMYHEVQQLLNDKAGRRATRQDKKGRYRAGWEETGLASKSHD